MNPNPPPPSGSPPSGDPSIGADPKIVELYNDAMQCYDRGSYLESVEKFSQVIVTFLDPEVYKEANLSYLDNSLKMAIAAYKNVHPEIVDNILETEEEDKERFAAVYRHFQDHREHSPQEIETEIFRYIPLGTAEIRDEIFAEGEGEIDTSTVQNLSIATASFQGPRSAMEDQHIITELKLHGDHSTPLLAVLDGHGDHRCARYCKDHLPAILQEELEQCRDWKYSNVYHSLCRGFVKIDKEWKDQVDPEDRSGTTTIAALFLQDALWIANVGDSRAVLIQDEKPTQLSEDAKPTIKKFTTEIVMRGGMILIDRVDGNLDMARSIGDSDNPCVSPRPDITLFDLNKIDKSQKNTLILACDGLWDVVSPQEAATICTRHDSAEEASTALKNAAFAKGTYDNVTVMVARIGIGA